MKIAPLQSVTSTALTSSARTTYPGQAVSFTATVNTRTAPVPVGTVSFVQGSTVVATVPLNDGTASYTTNSLPVGTTAITAVYNSTAGNLGSTSPSVTQSVIAYPTATSITSNLNPSALGQLVTLSAAVVNATGPVTAGTVTFQFGKILLGTIPLNSSGTASVSLDSLPVGTARIQAIYNGSTNDSSSVSPVLKQTVSALPTVTVISLTSQVRPNRVTRYFLVATTTSVGTTLLPTGTVVFRKNGHTIGSAKLKNGTAVLSISRKVARSGRFLAKFQGTARFHSSTSAPITVA